MEVKLVFVVVVVVFWQEWGAKALMICGVEWSIHYHNNIDDIDSSCVVREFRELEEEFGNTIVPLALG